MLILSSSGYSGYCSGRLTSLISSRKLSSFSSSCDINLFLTCITAVSGSDAVDVSFIDDEYDCFAVSSNASLAVSLLVENTARLGRPLPIIIVIVTIIFVMAIDSLTLSLAWRRSDVNSSSL